MGAIHRFHGGPGHQPWLYDNATESIVRSFLNLRMTLMPMLLAAGETATLEATPVARRLDLLFPTAERSNTTRTDQYFLGDDLLVAPFSSSGDANGTATREVWLPPGSYQDAWTGATVEGPQLVVATQPLGRIPLWHKKGGVLVTAPSALTIEEQDWSELTLELFPHALAERASDRSVAGPPRAEEALDATQRRAQQQVRRVVREGEPGEGTTVFSQEGTGGQLSIEIVPSENTPARAWLFRLNLAPGHTLSSAVVDGAAVSADAFAVLAPIPADRAADFFPLLGRGSAAAPEAGDVVELRLASAVGKRSVALQLAAQGA